MKKFKITVGSKTDIGNVKQVNQDALLCKIGSMNNNEFGLFVVCDGLGGLEYGEVASKKTTEYFEEWWNTNIKTILQTNDSEKLIRESLEEVLIKSNREIIQLSNEINSKIGTTASVLFILNKNYYIVHIGDSRIYEINKNMIQLTEDHSQYEMLRKQGIKNLQNVKKNVLTQCIGVNDKLDIFYKKGKISKNTNFLICSDGLHNKMDKESVINKFNNKNSKVFRTKDLQEICENLIDEVKEKKERDNITAISINVRQKSNKRKNNFLPGAILVASLCLVGGMAVVKSQKNKAEKENSGYGMDVDATTKSEEEILKDVLDILNEINPDIVDNFKKKYEEKTGEDKLSNEIKDIAEPSQQENQEVNNSQSNNSSDINVNSEEVASYEDRSELKNLINQAQLLYDKPVDENNQYQYLSREEFNEAIESATKTYNEQLSTKSIIEREKELLQEKINLFKPQSN